MLRNRPHVGYLVVSGSAMGALFAYATSAFVLQNMNVLSPTGYSIDFAVNPGGMTITALAAARLAGRVATRKVILIGTFLGRRGQTRVPYAGLVPTPT